MSGLIANTRRIVSTAIAAAMVTITAAYGAAVSAAVASVYTALLAETGAELIGWARHTVGVFRRSLYDKLAERVTPADFGAVGALPGVSVAAMPDDTAALTRAFNYVSANNAVLRIPGGRRYKFTSPLPVLHTRGGIDMDSVGANAMDGDALVYTGAAVDGDGNPLPGIVITGSPCRVNFCLSGIGQTAHGVLFQSVIQARTQSVRVTDFDGWGIKLNRFWDVEWGKFATENTGRVQDYAFSVNDDGDTSNMSSFGPIQVENPKGKGIYISPNCFCCSFNGPIHSEGLQPVNSVYAWVFGGQQVAYPGGIRLSSLGTKTDAHALISSYGVVINDLRAEEGISVDAEAYLGSTLDLHGPVILNTLAEVPNQVGIINVHGGVIAGLAGQTSNIQFSGTKVAGVFVWCRKKIYEFIDGAGFIYGGNAGFGGTGNTVIGSIRQWRRVKVLIEENQGGALAEFLINSAGNTAAITQVGNAFGPYGSGSAFEVGFDAGVIKLVNGTGSARIFNYMITGY